MKLVDYKELLLKRSNDFLKDGSVGIILKTPDEIGENVYGVFIGRMMMGTYNNNGPLETVVSISGDKCLNSINRNVGETSVTSSNFIHLTMQNVYNISMPRFILGEKVSIGVVDSDIKSLFIKPYYRNQIKNRPTDTLEMYVPASGNYDGDDLTDENKYFIRCDSVSQTIRIHMSNANGEISKYDLLLDGANGIASLTDGNRSVTINTESGEIFMTNEAGSTLSIREDAIDIICERLYIQADTSIEIESPSISVTSDNTELTISDLTGNIESMTLEGSSITENFTSANITNDNRNITSPVTGVTGMVNVSGFVCPGGIGFGAPTGQNPLPINPQISSDGSANFMGPLGMPLAKTTPLIQLLTIMATAIDAIGSAPVAIIPPTALAAVNTLSNLIASSSVKG